MKNPMKNWALAAVAGLALPVAALAADARIAFTQDAIRDLQDRARYPEWSRPILPGAADPLADARQPTRQAQAGPNGAAPTLSVWASTISAQAGERVSLFARLDALRPDSRDLREIVAAGRQTLAAQVTGRVEGEHSGLLGELAYADDGRAPDRLANDGIYSASFVLPAARAPRPGHAESLMVSVRALSASGDERRAVGGLQFSNPGATLTGRYRDFVRNGNLVIAAEADVVAAGRYYMTGTLNDVRGLPLASAQTAKQLSAGRQWIELSWYGLLFHDKAATGALQLGSVSLSAANGMPNALGPVLSNVHKTAALDLALLTRKPFNDPSLMDTARRLQATLPRE